MNLFLLSTSIMPDRSLAFTLTVIIAGLGIVLLTLMLLILIFNLFGKAVNSAQQRALKKTEKPIAPSVPAPPVITKKELPLPPAVDEGAPPEVVAAITAAVYMLEGEGAAVKSITPLKRTSGAQSVWAQAAIIENTKPF